MDAEDRRVIARAAQMLKDAADRVEHDTSELEDDAFILSELADAYDAAEHDA